MKTALISGGLGFIGSFIARKLVKDNVVDKIVLLDHFGRYVDSTHGEFLDYRKFRTQGIQDRIIIERGEARYFSVISNIMEKYRPELIYQNYQKRCEACRCCQKFHLSIYIFHFHL